MKYTINSLLHSCLPSQRWELQLIQKWPSIIGELKEHVHIEKMYKDMLVLGVYDSSWLQELYMLTPLLLKTINKELENHTIKSIRFKHTTKKEHVLRTKNTEYKDFTTEAKLSSKHKYALKAVIDKDLQSALITYLARCQRIE